MKRSDSQCVIVGFISRFSFPTRSFRNTLGLPSSQCTSMHMPRLDNPADSPHPHHRGCFTWTSSTLQLSPIGTSFIFGAMPALQDHGNPCGLRTSLCTLHLFCSLDCLAEPDRKAFTILELRHRRNTRYGWVVSPYPTGTFTLQGAPSFAWRTNGLRQRPRDVCAVRAPKGHTGRNG